jgi:hypothetical protein
MNKIKQLLKWLSLTPVQRQVRAEEKWLAQSVDLADLERRQRQLLWGERRGWPVESDTFIRRGN